MWDLDIIVFKGFSTDLQFWPAHFIIQIPYWESNRTSTSQEYPCILWH
jgi:hypothetical protein